MNEVDERLECMDDYEGGCSGKIERRYPLSPTGVWFPRCDAHWDERLDRQQEIDERYPVNPPSDWSPLDCGEVWSEYDY